MKVALECNYTDCGKRATRVMAMPPGVVPCYFVAPFCDEHAQGVAEEGGLPAAGPALRASAREIEGIR